MEGQLKKLKTSEGNYVYPITVSDAVFVDATKNLETKLAEMDSAISNAGSSGGGGGTVSPTSNLILGGNVRFKVDFITKTISFTTWNMWTSGQTFTLAAATKEFTALGTGTFYFVCFKNNTIELVPQSSIGSYTGFIIFGLMNTLIFPFAYPFHQIGVRGGTIYMKPDQSIGEMYMIGDSITFGGAFQFVQEVFYMPTVVNLGVNGKRMSGAGGMWTNVSDVSTTADLLTIMGGTNDEPVYSSGSRGSLLPIGSTFDTNTYIGAYQHLIEGVLTKNPSIRIIMFTPPRAWTSDGVLRSKLKEIGDDVKTIGAHYSIPVVDTYHEAGWNEINHTTFLSDKLHPNDAGKRRLSALCVGAIKSFYMKI